VTSFEQNISNQKWWTVSLIWLKWGGALVSPALKWALSVCLDAEPTAGSTGNFSAYTEKIEMGETSAMRLAMKRLAAPGREAYGPSEQK